MCIIRRKLFRPTFRVKNTLDIDESGSALLIALIILAVISLLGGILVQSSTTEVQVAGNDRLYKETFYAADGVTELAAELLEQDIACPVGFTNSVRGNLIKVNTLAFWQNSENAVQTPGDGGAGEGPRDFYLPDGYTPGQPHTNFTVGGKAQFAVGSAIEMAAGYEGKGKAAGAGGVQLIFDIAAQRVGVNKSQSIVRTQWRHVVGSEEICQP